MITAARLRCSAIIQPITLSVFALGAHQRQQPHAQPHNIPDPAAKASMSTAVSELSKRPYQLRVCDKAVLFSVQPELRRYAMRQRAYTLKHIATKAARSGRFDCAAYYAREALNDKIHARLAGHDGAVRHAPGPVFAGKIRSRQRISPTVRRGREATKA